MKRIIVLPFTPSQGLAGQCVLDRAFAQVQGRVVGGHVPQGQAQGDKEATHPGPREPEAALVEHVLPRVVHGGPVCGPALLLPLRHRQHPQLHPDLGRAQEGRHRVPHHDRLLQEDTTKHRELRIKRREQFDRRTTEAWKK